MGIGKSQDIFSLPNLSWAVLYASCFLACNFLLLNVFFSKGTPFFQLYYALIQCVESKDEIHFHFNDCSKIQTNVSGNVEI